MIANASDLSLRELERFGVNQKEAEQEALRIFRKGKMVTGWLGGVPAFLFWMSQERRICVTSFIATQKCFDNPVGSTRIIRRHLHDTVSRNRRKVVSYSASDHPRVEKWFKLIGFEPVTSEKSLKVFEYTLN